MIKRAKKTIGAGLRGFGAFSSGFADSATLGGAKYIPGFKKGRKSFQKSNPTLSKLGYGAGYMFGGIPKVGGKLGVRYGLPVLEEGVRQANFVAQEGKRMKDAAKELFQDSASNTLLTLAMGKFGGPVKPSWLKGKKKTKKKKTKKKKIINIEEAPSKRVEKTMEEIRASLRERIDESIKEDRRQKLIKILKQRLDDETLKKIVERMTEIDPKRLH